jgi:hypothetical protein
MTTTTEIGTGTVEGTGTIDANVETTTNLKGEKQMPDDYRREGREGDREGDRDRDRDEKWDVHPERPHKEFMEAAEDVQGALKVAWDVSRDVFKDRATMEGCIEVYDRILAQREI